MSSKTQVIDNLTQNVVETEKMIESLVVNVRKMREDLIALQKDNTAESHEILVRLAESVQRESDLAWVEQTARVGFRGLLRDNDVVDRVGVPSFVQLRGLVEDAHGASALEVIEALNEQRLTRSQERANFTFFYALDLLGDIILDLTTARRAKDGANMILRAVGFVRAAIESQSVMVRLAIHVLCANPHISLDEDLRGVIPVSVSDLVDRDLTLDCAARLLDHMYSF